MKLFLLIIAIFVVLSCWCLYSNNKIEIENDNHISQNTNDTVDTDIPDDVIWIDMRVNPDLNLSKASIIAQDFVKANLTNYSEFDFEVISLKGNRDIDTNKFNIIQEFTAKDSSGLRSRYRYKIDVEYWSREWENINNWKYGQLIIENCKTKKQKKYGKL